MKLSRIPGTEPTVKQYLSLKQSTLDMLISYQEACSEQAGVEVSFRDLVEQMLLDFMAEDKEFQRLRKDRKAGAGRKAGKTSAKSQDEAPSVQAPKPAPVNAPTTAPAAPAPAPSGILGRFSA